MVEFFIPKGGNMKIVITETGDGVLVKIIQQYNHDVRDYDLAKRVYRKLLFLKAKGEGEISVSKVSWSFRGYYKAEEIRRALKILEEQGKIALREVRSTRGRPKTVVDIIE